MGKRRRHRRHRHCAAAAPGESSTNNSVPRLFYVPRRGVVYFSHVMTTDEIDAALVRLMRADDDTFRTLVVSYDPHDSVTGVGCSWPWYNERPPTSIDLSHVMTEAAILKAQANAALESQTELRIGWMRRSASLLAMPNNDTQCGRCISCGDTLAAGLLFGHCEACRDAFKRIATEDGITLPERQQRQ